MKPARGPSAIIALSRTLATHTASSGRIPHRPIALYSPLFCHNWPSTPSKRSFTTTPQAQNYLQPRSGQTKKTRKGKPRMPTGGSTRGTTVVWGDYGLRMRDHDRRVSAAQLKIGEDTIRKRLRGMRYRLFMRVAANIAVYTSGNEVRMGKGKGKFDYWASRVAVSKIIFELKGDLHEKVVRDAFRLAAAKMPGLYEFVKKGDPAVMGLTKLTSITPTELHHSRPKLPLELTSERLPSTTPTPPTPSI
ncbi:MAG: mitochondrial ribosomal large subunit component [Piccolia ochrophora]|nr:MAG: mitochondrial ribosomal large subunit component [Piccolia ochrophora]